MNREMHFSFCFICLFFIRIHFDLVSGVTSSLLTKLTTNNNMEKQLIASRTLSDFWLKTLLDNKMTAWNWFVCWFRSKIETDKSCSILKNWNAKKTTETDTGTGRTVCRVVSFKDENLISQWEGECSYGVGCWIWKDFVKQYAGQFSQISFTNK